NAKLLRRTFPALSGEISHVIHVRRAGDFSSRQMGSFMLRRAGSRGVRRLIGDVVGIDCGARFALDIERPSGRLRVFADTLVNAAGPFAASIAAMTGVELPVTNVFQQKLAFEDVRGAVPRDLPFAIDVDAQRLDWSVEDRALLRSDPALEWLTDSTPGGVHCRPEGSGRRIKLGWAYNRQAREAKRDLAGEPGLHPHFAEIVLRRAARLLPALAAYVDSPPARPSQYGGYYTMTPENWPLVGPAGPAGAFLVAALSGFGSMAACAAGKLCASWIDGGTLPPYARELSPARYDDAHFAATLRMSDAGGLL
ncbi:MAG: NAD(P)/FAD-dependent oxidoreductase, partial [Woeseiaceae bacterium]